MPASPTLLKIRDATPGDIPSIIALERAAASAAHWTESQYQALFSPSMSGVQNLILLAEAASSKPHLANQPSLLGFLVARRISPEWELENIVVAPASQRTRIGRQLLKALLDKARQTNSESVFLEVRDSNTAARAFYEKSGFRQVGHRKSYYQGPVEDALLYRFDLR
ncbi:MAG TPA: ribosomal protein S18-alanine N-acetyltransferase [Candidatus Sulfotelmatobacter sp.]|nr:ribosomal protein S18-alanine N-acetyltransferase [Candidatus Sulfotelmatobacter sp.]